MKNLIMKQSYRLLIAGAFCSLFFAACQNQPDYKEVRQQVMDLHDKVMADGEKVVKNKMILDTIGKLKLKALKAAQPTLDTLAEKKKIAELVDKLNKADEKMMDWMHDFKADVQGKDNAEAVKYFSGEMTKIKALDEQYKNVITESDAYLKKLNLKPAETPAAAQHNHNKH